MTKKSTQEVDAKRRSNKWAQKVDAGGWRQTKSTQTVDTEKVDAKRRSNKLTQKVDAGS